VFRGLTDGHVLAMNASTGDVIWDVIGADSKAGEFYTAAPAVWEGRLYLGNAGSDYGGIGHIKAFDANTVRQLWSFDTVPSAGEAAKTWPSEPNNSKLEVGHTRPMRWILKPACFTRRSATQARISSESAAWATIFTHAALLSSTPGPESSKCILRRAQRHPWRVR
jgi:hypothetical protein